MLILVVMLVAAKRNSCNFHSIDEKCVTKGAPLPHHSSVTTTSFDPYPAKGHTEPKIYFQPFGHTIKYSYSSFPDVNIILSV